jgi:hypothetical protein
LRTEKTSFLTVYECRLSFLAPRVSRRMSFSIARDRQQYAFFSMLKYRRTCLGHSQIADTDHRLDD